MATSSSCDSWMRELNDASKLSVEVDVLISQRSSLAPSGSQTQRHMSTARRKMTILRTKLETLHSLLPNLPNKLRITPKEMRRRKDLLYNLSEKAGEMASTLNMSISPDRENLLGLDRKQEDVMKIASELNNQDHVTFQRQIIKEQDEDLAKLEETVISTKHIALAVDEELGLHTRLLENLEGQVDTTDSRLQRLQRKLGLLNRETEGECFTLILMVLAIVVLIVITWCLLKYS